MNKFYSTAFLALSLTAGFCQNSWTTYPQKKDSLNDNISSIQVDTNIRKLNYNSPLGNAEINKDSRIELIENTLSEEKKINGYTVQIEVSQQNNIIKDSKLKFIKAFPDEPIFDEYIAPNTYLFVGRYFDKNDALTFQNKIKDIFPNTMVIKKSIDPPVLKE
ncbi:MAG: hypothetical protein CL853_01440 [Crocinitomicaceae bacterium]|nr:hypothetical protein [Crocinitomicaceae bacterium]|tara:strand:- start:8923 stop:9408 length:486 start_codon:yes stop_codon:yes gene_type:complete